MWKQLLTVTKRWKESDIYRQVFLLISAIYIERETTEEGSADMAISFHFMKAPLQRAMTRLV